MTLVAGSASAALPVALNTTMTVPYPATATGNAVDLTVHYTSTAYTSGAAIISATGSPFTQSTTTSAPDSFSQVFDSPGGAITIAPGGAETLSWSTSTVLVTYEVSVDVPFGQEWVGSYEWSGVAGTFVPLAFASQSAAGVSQLQLVNQLPSTDITYSELSIFNNGSSLITGGSGSILGGQSANLLTPFTLQPDFALHVKDDHTGVTYDLTWGPYLPTPEPATMLLVGASLLAAAVWRRQRLA